MTSDVDAVLEERGKRYGTFTGHSRVSQRLKEVVREELILRDKTLDDDQAESLSMICHKIARIINGDPDYADNWVDIAGYAKLVADRLDGMKK